MKIGRNTTCTCGSGKKYKKCCLDGDRKKEMLKQKVKKITRRDLISGPYKNCPNCFNKDSFGVFTPIVDNKSYTRECIKCGYREEFILPVIKKKILYLDQFVISNLVKLLDKSHPSHIRIKADTFWSELFIKLEKASKSQAIVCPDSFYHKDESLIGKIDYRLMRRLYEHFSNGKTLYPSIIIEKNQIIQHFEGWLANRKTEFDFKPETISFEGNLHNWAIGLRISVGGSPYPGQIENLRKTNTMTQDQLKNIWQRWQNEKISFANRVKEETLGLGKGLIGAAGQFARRKSSIMAKMAAGKDYTLDVDDILPPLSNDILEEQIKIAKKFGLQGEQIPATIIKYFNDVDGLLGIPQTRISSVMFAGLAHRAANGKKYSPKSTIDIQFISSYLPYCDAIFVDKESELLLREFPKDTPDYLRLKEFPAKVFSLRNKREFLDYLDNLVSNIPPYQIDTLKDVEGDDYAKPFWSIIEDEKSNRRLG